MGEAGTDRLSGARCWQGDEARPVEAMAGPNVQFHLHSSTTKGVHPMTYEAIDRAQDAVSLARDVQDSETKDKAQIERVSALLRAPTQLLEPHSG